MYVGIEEKYIPKNKYYTKIMSVYHIVLEIIQQN